MIEVVDSGTRPAQELMDKDGQLLAAMGEGSTPILHHYQWQGDALSYGHFIEPEKYLDLDACKRVGLSLAKRVTGGGLIFHLTDLAFTFLIPAGHPLFSTHTMTNYATVNKVVIDAVEELMGDGLAADLLSHEPVPMDESCKHFCMAKPTRYDVVIGGKKVGGAAQRRTKQGLLHHGSISLVPMCEQYLGRVLRPGSKVEEAMGQYSFQLCEEKDLDTTRDQLRKLLSKHFARAFEACYHS